MQCLRSFPGRVGGVLLAVMLGVPLVVAVAAPAHAATTYTPTGTNVSFASQLLTLTDVDAAQTFSCSSLPLSGSVISSGTSRMYYSDMATTNLTGTGACSNAICGTTLGSAGGTWTLAITGDPIASSSPSWQTWPARMKYVQLTLSCANCSFRLTGTIAGTYDESSRRFTPTRGASGLVVDGLAPPVGAMCVTLDILAGDSIEVGGSWSSPSGPIDISNP